jgi:hypothetical protein
MPQSDMHRQRRGRNYALGGFLLVLVIIFFVVTLVKMKGGG